MYSRRWLIEACQRLASDSTRPRREQCTLLRLSAQLLHWPSPPCPVTTHRIIEPEGEVHGHGVWCLANHLTPFCSTESLLTYIVEGLLENGWGFCASPSSSKLIIVTSYHGSNLLRSSVISSCRVLCWYRQRECPLINRPLCSHHAVLSQHLSMSLPLPSRNGYQQQYKSTSTRVTAWQRWIVRSRRTMAHNAPVCRTFYWHARTPVVIVWVLMAGTEPERRLGCRLL